MSYKIAIASGKGGTGKTTISVLLYHYLANILSKKVQLVDCDVEEPNDRLFFNKNINSLSSEKIFQKIPTIDVNQCVFCRKCEMFCEFNAIVIIPPAKYAAVDASLCHSCGACMEACNSLAISEKSQSIGMVERFSLGAGKGLIEGKLKVGSSMQTMLIKELKRRVSEENEITIYDAPPGTSCSVVETVSDTDYVILVTEPTPFGLHDLKLMVELMRNMKMSFGVFINKANLGNGDMYLYLQENNITLLGEISFDKAIASDYAAGKILRNAQKLSQQMQDVVCELYQF